MARIGIFGAGYVGLVTGTCFAELGHEVVVRDVVPEKIDALRRGEIPIYEPGLDELVAKNRERLTFTTTVADAIDGAEFLYIAVGTPPTYSGDADLSAVWTVIEELQNLGGNPVVVMKSTVPVGTGEKVRRRLDAGGLANVGYVSNPEFLAEGTALRDFMNPDRIVIGAFDGEDGDRVEALHAGLGLPPERIVRCDVASAEMIKMAANAFLSTRISFINEIANVCELVGADVEAVAQGVGLDHRLGPHFLRAGIGYGGSCLTGDETVLVRRRGAVALTPLARLYAELDEGERVDVLAWRRGASRAEFLPATAATRRIVDGEIVEVRTTMGRRVRCTPDHPFVTKDGVKLAGELSVDDWLPLAPPASTEDADEAFDVLEGLAAAGLDRNDVRGRPAPFALEARAARAHQTVLTAARSHDFLPPGGLRLDELDELDLPRAERLPDAIWSAPTSHKRALLAGVWRGDGSWSYVGGGAGVVLEYGTVSRELADGLLRLLGDLGIVASLRIGRTTKSTCDTHRIRVSGADQVEQLLELVRPQDREAVRTSIARQSKRIASTGRRRGEGTSWVRVVDVAWRPFHGAVYSLHVPEAQTFVTTGGLTVHNCFPKDVSALKQLAGNSGYHFQLLSAVIEVNELQKRRVIAKLQKHLGPLRGKTVALLGLAFKPNTDDMREAPSLVIASRLIAEGAGVRAWDPVADGSQIPGVEQCGTILEAVAGADAAVIVTEWPQLRELSLDAMREAMAGRLVVDGRNLLDPDAVRAAGFAYESMGRPSSPFATLPETEERDPELHR